MVESSSAENALECPGFWLGDKVVGDLSGDSIQIHQHLKVQTTQIAAYYWEFSHRETVQYLLLVIKLSIVVYPSQALACVVVSIKNIR